MARAKPWTWKRGHFTIALLIGLGLLVLGAVSLLRPITCGGSTMHPGDRCVSSGGSVQTYEEARTGLRTTGSVEVALGSAAVIAGIVGIGVLGAARRH